MMAMSLESVKKIQTSHTCIRDFSLTNESYEVPNSKAHSYSLFFFLILQVTNPYIQEVTLLVSNEDTVVKSLELTEPEILSHIYSLARPRKAAV